MGRKILFTFLVFWFFSIQNVVALDLNVTVTNETCTGNGSLAFSVTNQVPGEPIFYAVYLLPNTTTPIVTTSNNSHSGLVAGSYLVIASQTVGGSTTTAQQTVFVINQIVALNFTISSVKVKCGNDGQITVDVTNGNPVSYQLLTGPMTTGLQSSNVFSGLSAGQYNIRVFDSCGEGIVQTYILTSLNPSLTIGQPIVSNSGNTSCNTLFISHALTEPLNTPTFGPFSIQVTAYPPSGGSPIVTTQTTMPLVIPSIDGVSYVYDLIVTDVCGNTYIRNNNQASSLINYNTKTFLENCNDYVVKFTVQNYVTSYTLNFISAPAGFNPVLANPNHPGPFTNFEVVYGNSSYYMPLGSYTVEITDSCGNSIIKTFTVEEIPSIPGSIVTSGGCGVGANLSIGLNPFRELATVILTSAPSGYSNPLPEDLSALIINGVFYFQGIPFGTYHFSLTDVCGNPYTYLVVVTGIAEIPNKSQRPGCNIGDGSIQIQFNINPPNPTTQIVFIEIVEAPAAFDFPLPYNVSYNISSTGGFSMNSLPAGFYKFKIIDSCGFESFVEETIIGFNIVSSTYNVTENCGSFNLQLNHNSNGTYITSYHLQKYDAVNNVWEHPVTGFDYVPNTAVSALNALTIINNIDNLNIPYLGTLTANYRILKVFFNYSNGTASLNRCIIPIHEFEFNGGPKIISASAFPCANNTQEVIIIATGGVPPLQYSIIQKDGQPFVVNNGVSNVFSGLTPGSYSFVVTDNCSNVANTVFDISLLQEPEIIASNLCNGSNGQLEIQNFPFVTYQWYNTLNPSVILSTSNTLQFAPFNSTANAGTYEVQLTTTNANSCINQTISYTISPAGFNPNAGNNANPSLCKENASINLNSFLSNPHDNGGIWTDSNGDIITNTTINPNNYTVGNYTFTYTVEGFCAVTDAATITIAIKDLPAAPIVTAPSPICIGENVLLEANTISNATYFWTGPSGFTSSDQNPLLQNFSSSNNGTYFVYATVDGCNSATTQVILNSNPLPDFTIDGTTSICVGQNETLTINPTNFNVNLVTIEWFYNGILLSTETSSTLQINQIGNYSAIIYDNGCSAEKDIEIIEKINSFDIELAQGCNENKYEINIINSSNFPNATYSWTGPNGFSSYTQNIVVPNLAIGQYDVEVTDVLGCKSNAFVLVENTSCFIPNGFSPDEDGYNDSFDLSGYDVKKIHVYNRYGRLVYDKEDYINEWKGQTNNNNKLPAGTYFYVLEFHEGDNKTGWVFVTY